MMASSHPALDSIDQFIRVGGEMAKVPILANPQYRSAAEDLYQIARQLLNANENMARWLNHFLLFDFRDTNARAHFFDLVKEYRAKKAGGGFRPLPVRRTAPHAPRAEPGRSRHCRPGCR